MAGTKPKFTIKWTKRDNKTWPVPGKTYEEMFKFFEKKNAAKEEWAKFHHERPSLSVEPDKSDPITDVTLMVGYTIVMPEWSKATSIGKNRKAAWDKMIAALKAHEGQHRKILEDQAQSFGATITSETDLSHTRLTELFNKFAPNLDKAQKAYDATSWHGVKEGVSLPAPDKVKD
jgi:predicted secreted Zn-dependent protease